MSKPRVGRSLSRRAVLGGLTAGIAAPAWAQGPTLEGVMGQVTAANFAAFDAFVTRNLDRTVRVEVTLEGAEAQGFFVEVSGEPLVAYRRDGRTQVSVTRGFTRRDGRYAVEGFYAVRYAGMHQGIEAIALEPALSPVGVSVRVTRLS